VSGVTLYEEAQGFAPWAYAVVGFALLICVAIGSLRMKTTVTPEGVAVSYGFLGTTRVALSDIARAEAVVYRPLRDYGGWGIRGFGRRRAWNVRGDRGVLLVRKDGSTFLIGSQRPRELLSALARAGVPTQDSLPADIREF
jgi:hypothetical protein